MADANETDDLELDIPAGDIEDQDTGQIAAETPEGEEDEDEVLISFEGEEGAPPPSEERDNSVLRDLRARNREQARELEALRRQQPKPQTIEVGEEPTLEGCDYDTDRFKTEWREWNSRSAEAKQAEADAQRAQVAQQEAWNKQVGAVKSAGAKLGPASYAKAEETIRSDVPEMHQALIVRTADDPEVAAKMVLALAASPAKRAEFAKIEDPVKAIAWLARLEGKLTVTQRKAPAPEQIVRGSAPLSAQADKHLERLETEAARTGDRSKVIAYKRELKAKARS